MTEAPTPAQIVAPGRPDFQMYWKVLQFPLLVIIMIGALLWFNMQQDQRTLTLGQEQSQTASSLAGDQQRETILVNYMNTISDMLIHDKLLQSQPTDIVRTVAQAQTLEALRALDPDRKAILLRFLYETKLIDNDYHIISLADAPLQNAHLSNIDLRDTYLVGANLAGADLRGANLSYATLVFTSFAHANLAGADLRGTNMQNVNVTGANLTGANLRDATGIGNGQLAKASSLKGATMPDGSVHA